MRKDPFNSEYEEMDEHFVIFRHKCTLAVLEKIF
jgi:hypothetical protein